MKNEIKKKKIEFPWDSRGIGWNRWDWPSKEQTQQCAVAPGPGNWEVSGTG